MSEQVQASAVTPTVPSVAGRDPSHVAKMLQRNASPPAPTNAQGEPTAEKPKVPTREDLNKVQAPQAPQRPDHVPEKFWDAKKGEINTEALLKSYSELEKSRSKPTDKTETAPSEAVKEEAQKVEGEKPAEKTEEAPKDNQKTAPDWSAVDAELATSGKLSDATLKSLADFGIPVELSNAISQLYEKAIIGQRYQTAEMVGGMANLERIEEGLAKLPEAERVKFETALKGDNWQIAMEALKGRFLVEGSTDAFAASTVSAINPLGSVAPFASRTEQNEAINRRDAKGRRLYDYDKGYRDSVQARIRASVAR